MIADDELEALAGGCKRLSTLQLSRMRLQDGIPMLVPQLPAISMLTLYIEDCRRQVLTSFPNLGSAICRDWPAQTNPGTLQVRLTAGTLSSWWQAGAALVRRNTPLIDYDQGSLWRQASPSLGKHAAQPLVGNHAVSHAALWSPPPPPCP